MKDVRETQEQIAAHSYIIGNTEAPKSLGPNAKSLINLTVLPSFVVLLSLTAIPVTSYLVFLGPHSTYFAQRNQSF